MTAASPLPRAHRVPLVVRVFLGLLGVVVALLLSGVRRDIPVDDLIPSYAPEPSRFVEIEGIRVHYRDEGSGPPLLLIHGTSSSLHT